MVTKFTMITRLCRAIRVIIYLKIDHLLFIKIKYQLLFEWLS